MTGVGVGVCVQVVEVNVVVTTAVNVLVLVVDGMRGQVSVGSTSEGSCGGSPGGTTKPPGLGGLAPGGGQFGAG